MEGRRVGHSSVEGAGRPASICKLEAREGREGGGIRGSMEDALAPRSVVALA